jgi:hypothetical protein
MGPAGVLLAIPWETLLQGDPRYPLALLVGAGVGVFFFFMGFRKWRYLRLIQDTPTAKVRSMALGRVEIHGHAEGKGELSAPFTGLPCVYYRYEIEQEVSGNRHRRWRTLDKGSSESWPFYLEDETGRALVDPHGALVDIPTDYRETNPPVAGPLAGFLQERGINPRTFFGFRKKLRFTEWHIAPGDEIYVLGVAQERGGLVHERRVRIAEKLAALKADPEAMAHFDTDGDGHIAAEEWEVARRLTVQEVEGEGFEDRVVVAQEPSGATPFYISDRDEKEIVKKHRWHAVGGVFGGAGLAIMCLAGLLHHVNLLGR